VAASESRPGTFEGHLTEVEAIRAIALRNDMTLTQVGLA
jgi:hypothetical protein